MKWREIGLGTLPRLAMCINIVLCIVHIYIANMQYIRNYHARYKYTIQVAHAHPTMHHIRLVMYMLDFLLLLLLLHIHVLRSDEAASSMCKKKICHT